MVFKDRQQSEGCWENPGLQGVLVDLSISKQKALLILTDPLKRGPCATHPVSVTVAIPAKVSYVIISAVEIIEVAFTRAETSYIVVATISSPYISMIRRDTNLRLIAIWEYSRSFILTRILVFTKPCVRIVICTARKC